MRVEVDDGVELHVERWDGADPPFLLVHGLASNLRLWDGVADHLAALGHAVVAVDLRGHGRSSKPDEGYGVPLVAADLAALVGVLALGPVVAVGQSWGGNVVLELAASRPELVAGVACVDGGWIELARRFPRWEDCRAALSPPPTTGLRAAAVEAMFRQRHPDWPASGIDGAMACFEVRADGTVAPHLTLGRHLLALRGLWEHHPADRYGAVDAPVLLVPARSGPVPWADDRRAEVDAAVAGLTHATVEWLEGDHDLHAQRPERVAELLAPLAVEVAAP